MIKELENLTKNMLLLNIAVLDYFNEKKEKEKEEEKKKQLSPESTGNKPPQCPPKEIDIPFPPSSEDPKYYIQLIADNWKISFNNTISVLNAIHSAHPGALLNLLLSTVAKELDLSYDGHIADSKSIYTFNPMDAKIYEQPAQGIKRVAYKYFAAFRTREDAVFAIQMVNNIKNYIMRCINEQKN